MRFQITASAVALCVTHLFASNALAAAACTMNVTNILFSPYNPLLSARVINETGSVEVLCKIVSPPIVSVSYNVDISAGFSNSFVARTMRQGGDTLAYNIFKDSGASQVWGDFTGGSRMSGNFVGFPALNVELSNFHRMYSAIAARQMNKAISTPGLSYQDQLLVTLSF
jgi:spore coat protein U-like protein